MIETQLEEAYRKSTTPVSYKPKHRQSKHLSESMKHPHYLGAPPRSNGDLLRRALLIASSGNSRPSFPFGNS